MATQLRKQRRARRTRAEWMSIVERFKRSGLTQRAFAEHEDIGIKRLGMWVSELSRAERVAPAVKPEPKPNASASMFLPLKALVDPAAPVEIAYRSGTTIRLNGTMAERFIGGLLSRL
jgi:hypothetical protein